jgi:hypothetical protein
VPLRTLCGLEPSPNSDGQVPDVRRESVNEAWNAALTHKDVMASGVPPTAHFHDLRNTYASLLIEAGESVKGCQCSVGS